MLQDEALRVLKSGANVYLTGAAGSGKTHLLNQYIRYVKDNKILVGVTASTGIAATHMEGITIHSWAGIGLMRTASDREISTIVGNKRFLQRFVKTQTLIIDEVSMLDADRLDLLDTLLREARYSHEPFGGMQVVLCGDFFQLPPVASPGEVPPRPIYESDAWKRLDLKVCYLHEQHRQGDQDFLEVLNAIRSASVDAAIRERLRQCRSNVLATGPTIRFVRLYTHNVNVDNENLRELAKLSGEARTYSMELAGVPAVAESLKKGCLAPERLAVKIGSAVMFVKNNFEKGYVNGTLGKIRGFDENNYPIVELMNGEELLAEPAIWSVEENGKPIAQMKQIPLRLAWAITVHKSQGMTLDAAEVDLSRCFEPGMGYVALSRVRSLKGLRLLGMNEMAFKVNEATMTFDRELRAMSDEVVRQLQSMQEKKIEQANPNPYSPEKIRENHPSAYAKWTLEEESRLVEGFSSGKKVSELAEMLGRKTGGIRSRLSKLGLINK